MPGSESARKRIGQGAKEPGSESSRERIGQGPTGRFASGSELARERKGSVPPKLNSLLARILPSAFWHNQDIVYDFRAQLQGTGSWSGVLYK